MPAQKLEYGLLRPIDLDTWWEFRWFPFAVSFNPQGWGSNTGLSGELHIGPVGQSEPLRICMSDKVFVDLVNEGKLEQVELTPELTSS